MFNPSLYRGDFDIRTGKIGGAIAGPTLIFPANPIAVYRSVVQNGSAGLFLSYSEPSAANEGSVIVLSKQTWEWFWERHGLIVTLPVWYFPVLTDGPLFWCEMTFQPHARSP